MADTYEKNLGAKSAITSSDYIRVVGSDNVSYKQPMSFFPTKAEVDALTTVTTPTGATFSSKLSNTELTIRRCGKHIVGHAVFRADQALPANGETILTGLPYSDYRLQVMGICVAGSESYKTKRFAIYNGTLSTYWSGTNFISGDTWLVNFSYIATN